MSHPMLDQYDEVMKAICAAAILGGNADHLIASRDRLRLSIVAALKIADIMAKRSGRTL